MSDYISLKNLPHLAVFFKLFNSGAHLNRLTNAQLWADLEREQEAYSSVFAALGYQLSIDSRGFAWFQVEESSPAISNQSRQFALLFMLVFDFQADAGVALNRFTEWRIDKEFLHNLWQRNQDLLVAEQLDVDALLALLNRTTSLGLTSNQADYWQLLPAVFRYLDHIQAIAEQAREDSTELEALVSDKESL